MEETKEREKIEAPFTEEQIDNLNLFQMAGVMHGFTCGSGNRTDKHHKDGEGYLIATEEGWKCPFCDYTQDWAHSFMGGALHEEHYNFKNFKGFKKTFSWLSESTDNLEYKNIWTKAYIKGLKIMSLDEKNSMTDTQKINFIFTCTMYKQKLKELGLKPMTIPHDKLMENGTLSLGHICGMLDKMIEFALDGKVDKAYRWLGFVQGVLWTNNIYSIDELKMHNTSEKEYEENL